MRWDRPNAEAIMALAALWHSNPWKPYWNAQQAERPAGKVTA